MTITRRDFVGTSAAALGASLLTGAAGAKSKDKKRKRAPSDIVNVAVIGAGGMGSNNAANLTSQNIVAIADVDFEHVAKSLMGENGQINPERVALKEAYDKAAKYSDYREMFDTQKDIDAVV